jgi:hypothetical protein
MLRDIIEPEPNRWNERKDAIAAWIEMESKGF